MIGEYLVRLAVLIPLVGGMAWGSLWLWKRVQTGMPIRERPERAARVIEVIAMGTAGKLTVVDFRGQELLIAVSRGQIALIASHDTAGF